MPCMVTEDEKRYYEQEYLKKHGINPERTGTEEIVRLNQILCETTRNLVKKGIKISSVSKRLFNWHKEHQKFDKKFGR